MWIRWVLILGFAAGCQKRGIEPMAIGIAPGEPFVPSVAPATDPPPAAVAPSFADVHFAFDSAVIRAADVPTLEANLGQLVRDASLVVRIEGHTDERGAATYNRALGQRRAEAVRAWLVGRGVPAERVLVISRGEDAPVAAGHDEASWAENRRAATLVVPGNV